MRETQEDPVPLGQPFEVRGKTAQHPGDFGDWEEDANCRCGTLPEFPNNDEREITPEQRTLYEARFLKSLVEDEARMRRAAEKSFQTTIDRVLETYDRIFQEAA
jgi:hypothetical protein